MCGGNSNINQYGPFNGCFPDPFGYDNETGIRYNSSVWNLFSVNGTMLQQEILFRDASCTQQLSMRDPVPALPWDPDQMYSYVIPPTVWRSSCREEQSTMKKVLSSDMNCVGMDKSSGIVMLRFFARPSCSLESAFHSHCFKVGGCIPTIGFINNNLPASCTSSTSTTRLTEGPGGGSAPSPAPTVTNSCNFMAFDSRGGEHTLTLSFSYATMNLPSLNIHAL